ncbi:MAG: hypothetical protein ACP5I6_06250 [Caldisphaera sp.]|nr:MAG: hypothetical protein C0171_02115 [Caldisphaera sp.]
MKVVDAIYFKINDIKTPNKNNRYLIEINETMGQDKLSRALKQLRDTLNKLDMRGKVVSAFFYSKALVYLESSNIFSEEIML